MFKDVLVGLTAGPAKDTAVDFALAVADAFGAHVAGVAFAFDPVVAATVMGGMPTDFLDAQLAANTTAAEAAKAGFERAAARAGVSFEAAVLPTSIAGAADQFGRMARHFDLVTLMQSPPDGGGASELIIESALFQSGRPLLLVPYVHSGGLRLQRAMVCWDGSRAAARALADAMPLLTQAKAVDVVMVTEKEAQRDTLPGADLGQHLARHGLAVGLKSIVSREDVASTLLSHAADISADLLVMGAYGHSRLREFILGGVTRGMLGSLTVPCLMSH